MSHCTCDPPPGAGHAPWCPLFGIERDDLATRLRAAAEVAEARRRLRVARDLLNLADDVECTPPQVVEAIGQALNGQGPA